MTSSITYSQRTTHSLSSRRRRITSLLLALTLGLSLLTGLGVRAAYGQPAPQLLPGLPALTLQYTDDQGPGTVRITPGGPDPASGGTAIAVSLVQHEIPYTGNGFMRLGELGGYVLDVTVTSLHGDSYHLSGTLHHDVNGVHWRGQGRWWATWNRTVSGAWQMTGGRSIEPSPRPTLGTTVWLEPVSRSAVRGQVRLTALPEGETRFDVNLTGLLPGQVYRLHLRAGTPGLPSASFTEVTAVSADAVGRASTSGLVRFRGTEDIPLLDIADGNHIFTVVASGKTVAVGRIPVLQPLG